ncbi:DUF2752 domain-containing protein [Nocardioides sp. 31GB23]|uniref:DUF2752 domain-containing protein n=1 Tax=Nocardioides sp. 31GB23 TaxID=3156065 RepID=UPI0032AF18FF
MSVLAPVAPPPTPRRERLRAPALTIGGLALATIALRLHDPHVAGSWGICPSAALGFWCPGCGGLRAVNDLTHGDVASAASSNLLLVVLMPVAVALLAAWALSRWHGRRAPRLRGRAAAVVLVAGLVVVGAFTLLRNLPLPVGTWLAP